MAKTDAGIFSPSYGALGPVVTYVRNGKTIMYLKPRRHDANTPLQQHVRMIFSVLMTLVRSCTPVLRCGLRNLRRKGLSANNAAFKLNYNNGTIQGTGTSITLDFTQFVIAAGSGVNVGSPAIAQGTGHTVNFSWVDNTGLSPETLASDQVAVALVNAAHPERTVAYDLSSTSRLDGSLTIAYPPLWAGDMAHAYIFTYSSDGKVISDSQYVGTIVLA